MDVSELFVSSSRLSPLRFLDEVEEARGTFDGVTKDGEHPAPSSCCE